MQTAAGVTGTPRYLLRAEGLVVLGLVVLLYWRGSYSWILFGALFLVPDISMLGYLINPRVGAITYNAIHTYIGVVLLALVGLAADLKVCIAISLIWAAHIGFDRLLGYGLKYPTAFGATHLGSIGHRH
jgi:hypothetical protein